MLSLLSLPNSSPRPRSNSHNSTRHGQLHFARPASSCRPPVAQGRPFTLPYLQRPQLSTSAGLPTPTPPAAVPRLPAVVVVGVGCAMYDPLQFRWRSPSLSRASVSRSARHISLSLRIRVAFSSVPLSRVGGCLGREISLTRRPLEEATTRKSGRWMGLAVSAASLPRGDPALSQQCFVSRLAGSRVPPPSLLTAARGGLHPSWFYEAASVALGARLSRWAGAGIADMDEVVRQGKKPWCCCARGSRRLTPRPAALWFSLLFLKHSCMSSAPASHTHNEPSRIMVPPPPAPCAV